MRYARTVALVSCLAFAGCATQNPQAFADHVNNAVADVHTSTVAAVSIGTDILGALVALVPAVLNFLGAI
jgi:hypothetical protein